MKPSRVITLLWLISAFGVFIAASQNWYAAIHPIPELKSVVATGLESFPLLSTIPWLALLCLGLVWYFGVIGRIFVAALTALLSLAGIGQLLIQQQNPQVIARKIEKATGIIQTTKFIIARTEILWPRFATILLLLSLAIISIAAVFTSRSFGRKRIERTTTDRKANKVDSNRGESLWEQQND